MSLLDDIINNAELIAVVFVILILGLHYVSGYFTIFADVLLLVVTILLSLFGAYIVAIILYSLAEAIYERIYGAYQKKFSTDESSEFIWQENLED